MTAPDPLKCLDSRAFKGVSLCGEPDSAHCPGCEMCPGPGNCVCPTSQWKKGDRVRISYDAIYYAEPSIKPDQYALVVLPGTDLDDNVLITNRFRVPLTAMSRPDNNTDADDKAWLDKALDAYAQHGGATNWAALVDVVSRQTAESYRSDVTAAIAPLLAEIRRLTAEVENLKHSKETS